MSKIVKKVTLRFITILAEARNIWRETVSYSTIVILTKVTCQRGLIKLIDIIHFFSLRYDVIHIALLLIFVAKS